MSTIGGIGSYGGISLTGFRNKQSEEQGELAQLARNVEKTTRTANAESEREFRARQTTDEGFARLRVAFGVFAAGQPQQAPAGRLRIERKGQPVHAADDSGGSCNSL